MFEKNYELIYQVIFFLFMLFLFILSFIEYFITTVILYNLKNAIALEYQLDNCQKLNYTHKLKVAGIAFLPEIFGLNSRIRS